LKRNEGGAKRVEEERTGSKELKRNEREQRVEEEQRGVNRVEEERRGSKES
jgi:hypothetical protein